MAKIKLENMKSREIIPGYRVRFVHSERMTLAYWDITADAVLPEHSHENEQVANVIEGVFELIIDGDKQQYQKGDVAIIPSGVKHSGRAITNCKIIDVFYPIREDYRSLEE